MRRSLRNKTKADTNVDDDQNKKQIKEQPVTRKKTVVQEDASSSSDNSNDVYSETDESEAKVKLKKGRQNEKQTIICKKNVDNDEDGSSSDSSVGDYFKTGDEIDLNSSFFTLQKVEKDFSLIEKKMFSGINKLSDSNDSESDNELEIFENANKVNDDKFLIESKQNNFEELHNFTKKIEETKAAVQKYKSKESAEENKLDILHLLSVGETRLDSNSMNTVDSDDNSSSDNEMDWEEVENKDIKPSQSVSKIPKEGVQITVELPMQVQKKKGVDFVAAMKRRLNRIKKENQVYIHKVHLLCWIAHGNYVNTVLNSEKLLGLTLSLLPSEHCYPPKHADLNYLEMILRWYCKVIKLVEKPTPQENTISLLNSLELQINKKQANLKKDFVLLFICILRSLGLQCRLILSLQCLPFRPLNSELCSLSTKIDGKDSKSVEKKKVKINKQCTEKNKSEIETVEKVAPKKEQTTSKSNVKNLSKIKKSEIQPKSLEKNNEKSLKTVEILGKIRSKPNIKNLSKNKKYETISKNPDKIDLKCLKKDNEEIKSSQPNLKKLTGQKKSEPVSKTAVTSNKSNLKKVEMENRRIKPNIKNLTKSKIETNKTNTETKTKSSPNLKSLTKMQFEVSNKKSPVKENKESNKRITRKTKDSEKNAFKETNKITASKSQKEMRISQTDGADDDEEPVPSSKLNCKPNLSKLKHSSPKTCTTKRPTRKAPMVRDKYKEPNSDDDFKPDKRTSSSEGTQESPSKQDINVNKKRSEKPIARPSTSRIIKQLDVRNDIINLIKESYTEQKYAQKQKLVSRKNNLKDESEDSDYDLEPVVKKKKSKIDNSEDEFKVKSSVKVKQRVKPRSQIDPRVLSTDSDNEEDLQKKKKVGNDVWVEVFLEAEEKWISVDVVKGEVHCVAQLNSRASSPVSYILAWNNNLAVKDVTARYCPHWNTVTRKLRTDPEWWATTLKPFAGRKTARDKEEDEDLARQQLDQPLPKTIGEYKNHPLYALKRHLLKFEAIWPPDALTLGFVRNEAVYARECVHTLHSREIWLKHAKVVKLGEQPYKIVKARPKYDRSTGSMITDKPLEIFGKWQVDEYVPPTAENGIVPRNAFGNVELFKPCMLPKGTVHLQLPGLNKVSRKLQIDCAPALVGFEFHTGGTHPSFDGYIVCEEFQDTLIAAWEQEQVEAAKREIEKIEKRVYDNWKKLIKGLLIRERLKVRYEFGVPSTSGSSKRKKKSKGPRFIAKKCRVVSGSESESN